METARQVFPRILHIDSVIGAAFNLGAADSEDVIAAGNPHHACGCFASPAGLAAMSTICCGRIFHSCEKARKRLAGHVRHVRHSALISRQVRREWQGRRRSHSLRYRNSTPQIGLRAAASAQRRDRGRSSACRAWRRHPFAGRRCRRLRLTMVQPFRFPAASGWRRRRSGAWERAAPTPG